MALNVKYPDKLIAGLHQSCTITTEEGRPEVKLRLGDGDLAHRLIFLGPPKDAPESTTTTEKYKISFFLPEDAMGKTLQVAMRAGDSTVEETKEVVAE
jgi:hypothetical protein